MYLKTLACKSQEFLGNRHLLSQLPSGHSIHICTRFCAAHSTIYTIYGYSITAGQITHRSPAITNWNFWFFFGSRINGYKRNFLKLVILLIFDSVPDKGKDLLEDILPNEMIRILNLMLCLCLPKIRFIMADSRKYRKNVWNILDTFSQYLWAV